MPLFGWAARPHDEPGAARAAVRGLRSGRGLHRRCRAARGFTGSVRAGQAQAGRHQLHHPAQKAVIPLLDEIDTAARDLHSVNTVRFADGKATGFNTDILGFAESLNRDGVSLQGKKVLLLGYGGAASVMAYHCVTQGAYLTITGRNLEKAEALQKQLTDAVPGARISVFSRRHIPRDIHIVLNSTPVGMYPKENAAPLHYLPHKTEYVFDAIYNPPVTSTMKLANPRKTKTRDGLFMLVMQAAHAQTIWTGVTFEPQACETILRRTYGKMAVKRLHEKHGKKNLVLCGFMGSGKTTIGRKLARLTGLEFIDADIYLEAKEGRKSPRFSLKRVKPTSATARPRTLKSWRRKTASCLRSAAALSSVRRMWRLSRRPVCSSCLTRRSTAL